MKTRTPRTTKSGSKKRRIAKPNCTTRIFEDNYRELQQMIRAQGSNESEILREIVSDWFRMKKVQALGRDQTEDPIRRIYERVVEEKITAHISPLTASLQELKKMLGAFTGNRTSAPIVQSPTQNGGNTILEAIESLRALIEQTGSDLSETNALQVNQLDQIQKAHLALQAIGSENFAASWSILDLIIRYVVEMNLRDQQKSPDDVEREVTQDRAGLRLEGLRQIADVEELFSLPQELRLAELVLPQSLFQPNGHSNSAI